MDSTVLKERRKCIVNKITDELLKIVSDFLQVNLKARSISEKTVSVQEDDTK